MYETNCNKTMSRICVWRGSKELLQQVALCVKLRVGVVELFRVPFCPIGKEYYC